MTKILILGGTKEAADLASKLVAEGHDVTTSLAGRTREPKPVAGDIRIGGFGGAEGLAAFLSDNGYERLVDATHPFAKQISENAKLAAHASNVDLEVHSRAPWAKREEDDWIEVTSLEEARDSIPKDARVLLALGSQHIAMFADRKDVFFLVRRIDKPEHPLPFEQHSLVLGLPSSDWREEASLLSDHSITHIVCRNSGGTGAYAKIEAARELCLPVIMISR